MIKHNRMFTELCVLYLLVAQFWLPVMAIKKTNFDELMVEDQRTHMRQNYVVQRALNEDIPEFDNIGVAYATDTLSQRGDPEDMEYANMIRDDIILLDNSVETRTRKRGNIKMKKFNRGVIQYSPCNCDEGGEVIYLGPQYVPSAIESRKCNKDLCTSNFGCQRRVYNITVLKKKEHLDESSSEQLPDDIRKHWVTIKKPITIACFCTSDFRDHF